MIGEDVKEKIWEVQVCVKTIAPIGERPKDKISILNPHLQSWKKMKMNIRDAGYTCLITSRIN